jgi:hypothetical protein
VHTVKSTWIAAAILTVLSWAAAAAVAAETLSLSGPWQFRRDDRNVGLAQKWYEKLPPAPKDVPCTIHLPGTTDEAKAGLANTKKPTLDGLYRTNVYTGPAWYQRQIEIPAAWKGKRITLFLERVRWVSQAWLDGKPVGQPQDSLIAPHVHELGIAVEPGKHTLTLRVDNTPKINLGVFVSALYGGTPTDMNGIVGRIELAATPPVWIDDVQVYPDVDRRLVNVTVRIGNATGRPAVVSASCGLSTPTTPFIPDVGVQTFRAERAETLISISLPMPGDTKLWDEFQPSLYNIAVAIGRDGRTDDADVRVITVGFRKFAARGTQFTINGRPLFLRGTLECAVFPLTGYPPCDVPAWQRIYRIMKSYGLNFIRFHSWCPPEAAFAAADIEGIMIQAEGPQANVPAGEDPRRDAFTEQELLRMVRTYGNHPSFCLMTLGNEYGGSDAVLSHWVDMLIKEDPRHLYSSASAAQITSNRQFTEAGPRGIHGPGTEQDFRDTIAKDDRPRIGHEIGQWTFYPNFDEMKKYTGVLKPRNFDLVRDSLAAHGMLDLAPQIFQATGRQAMLLYKEEIEVLLRTPGHAGFSLLDLHDYPSQGTALIGPLDPFWDSKGFVAPEVHRQYCGPSVPLLRMPKRTFTADETFTATADIAHFGPADLDAARPRWCIRDAFGREVAAGALPALRVPTGQVTPLGTLRASLAKAAAPCKLTVSVSLENSDIVNQWEIWVYPPAPGTAALAAGTDFIIRRHVGDANGKLSPPAKDTVVVVSRKWDDRTRAALAKGERVLLMPEDRLANSLPGKFLPVFWSPVWFPSQKPNTMGILCDPRHPVFAQFPTEFYSNWQWWDLLEGSRSVILDDAPAEFRPIVQVIDNLARNEKIGNLFEARVGKGRLLVCTLNLSGNLQQRPAARQFVRSLYNYLASDEFLPREELTLPVLDKILAPSICHGTLARLGAKIIEADSEDRAHHNVAASAIDGDPDTFWHTRWSPKNDPMPHHLTIDIGRAVAIQGVSYLARQDMANGRVAEAEVYCSNDRKAWGPPAAKVRFRDRGDVQTVRFEQPIKARYLKFVVRSEIHGRPYAAVAELDILTDAH